MDAGPSERDNGMDGNELGPLIDGGAIWAILVLQIVFQVLVATLLLILILRRK